MKSTKIVINYYDKNNILSEEVVWGGIINLTIII